MTKLSHRKIKAFMALHDWELLGHEMYTMNADWDVFVGGQKVIRLVFCRGHRVLFTINGCSLTALKKILEKEPDYCNPTPTEWAAEQSKVSA